MTNVYLAFSEILEYPEDSIEELVSECTAALTSECPEAGELLGKFRALTAGKGLGALQELYTNAFDLHPDCTPNLGYHLFGDDSRRGVFLAELKGRLEQSGVMIGVELPDHLSLILRYIDAAEEEGPVLIEDCLLPALAKMAEILDRGDNPYQFALRSLLLWLRFKFEMIAQPADAVEV